MNNAPAPVRYVSIGQGRSVHLAHWFAWSGDDAPTLAAKCDQSGFARSGRGRKVRPIKADGATCKACLRIAAAEVEEAGK